MKTFTDFIQLTNNQDLYSDILEETTLRTMSAIALTAKVRQLKQDTTNKD